MTDLIGTLAYSLARLYAGKVAKPRPAVWNPDNLWLKDRPATTFRSRHPEHAFAKFLTEFEKHYTDAARGAENLGSAADLPFIGANVLAGDPPTVVLSQRSYSSQPGSVSLWAMLFPFDDAVSEEYATTREWRSWRSRYPQYQRVICGNRPGLSFGLDPESLVVTDACPPPGCKDEPAFLNEFISALPRPRMVMSLGGDAAKRLNMEDRWRRLRDQQNGGRTIDPREAIGHLQDGVAVVVSPFVFGNNAKDLGGLHFMAAAEATRTLLA